MYSRRVPDDGLKFAWSPDAASIAATNLGRRMAAMGLTYPEFHRWSVDHWEEFWTLTLRLLNIPFRTPPSSILDPASEVSRPYWFPGATLNIAESCFTADPAATAIVYGREGSSELRRVTYGELRRLANRVANGLDAMALDPWARVALYLPMSPEAVAAYLGIVLSGRSVVGIADAAAPEDLANRLRLSDAAAVITVGSFQRDGKMVRVAAKVGEAKGPPAILAPSDGARSQPERPGDRSWEEFLGGDVYEAVPRAPTDRSNLLFSSGTTKDPKVIPWTHTTPIKCASDAYWHHDVQPGDVLAWPTSYGWMMGPWLTYGSLVNHATMAVYNGAPQRREFGEFVAAAGVTMLGVVPKLVRLWRNGRTMEGLDWSRVRRFSSTAEPSDPGEMLYLMHLASNAPVIEYCGGTEIGGGYVAGTLVQPAAPGTFSTPALGLDFYLLDEAGRPADRGEVAIVPPSLGLSTELLNYDHEKEYFAGMPRGPNGEVLRRHGDRMERLARGYYRHHGRMDDMINLNGVKTSSEEIRAVLNHPLVADAKPVAVDVEGFGQAALVVYVVPRQDAADPDELREGLRRDFEQAIKTRLNPLLAHIRDVVLVSELPQAGPGKTRTMRELQKDYLARSRP